MIVLLRESTLLFLVNAIETKQMVYAHRFAQQPDMLLLDEPDLVRLLS